MFVNNQTIYIALSKVIDLILKRERKNLKSKIIPMTFVVLFIIISIITGFLLTYFLSARYSIFERVAYGTVIGLGLHTWIVYLFSLMWGLSGKSIYHLCHLAYSALLHNFNNQMDSFKEKDHQ